MGHTFKGGHANPLRKASLMAIFEELQRRAEKNEVKIKENKNTYSILVDKEEVKI